MARSLERPFYLLRFFDTLGDNRIILNGQTAGRLCSNPDEAFDFCEVPLPPGFFQPGDNLIQIVAGEDDSPLNTSSLF